MNVEQIQKEMEQTLNALGEADVSTFPMEDQVALMVEQWNYARRIKPILDRNTAKN